jgi:hypothetical protein
MRKQQVINLWELFSVWASCLKNHPSVEVQSAVAGLVALLCFLDSLFESTWLTLVWCVLLCVPILD